MVQEVSYDNDKVQKSKGTATVTKGTRDNNGHKVRRQSITQERGSRLSSFVVKRMFTRGDPSPSHTMTSVPGSSVLLRLKRNKGLMRDSNVGILWLNTPRQRTLLFIYSVYNSLHVLIPNSQSFPLPTPSPLATINLTSTVKHF